jgi:hypothetical protein
MSTLIFVLCAGINLFFLKDSPDLLVKISPAQEVDQVTLHYNYSGTQWQSVKVPKTGQEFNVVLDAPDTLKVVGLYCGYDSYQDDNSGELYLYEVSRNPKMLMPFTFADLDVMIGQARKKITSGVHVSEAIRLLDYLDELLMLIPVIKNSSGEQKRDFLRIEVRELQERVGRK